MRCSFFRTPVPGRACRHVRIRRRVQFIGYLALISREGRVTPAQKKTIHSVDRRRGDAADQEIIYYCHVISYGVAIRGLRFIIDGPDRFSLCFARRRCRKRGVELRAANPNLAGRRLRFSKRVFRLRDKRARRATS